MSGKPGQLGSKPVEIPSRFAERFLEDMDRRSTAARELRDRLQALANDLGGMSGLSYQELSLCKRLIHLESLIEEKELRLAQGHKTDENVYFNAINSLSGLLSKIGLKKRVKVLSLNDYLQAKTSEPVRTKQAKEGADPGPESRPDMTDIDNHS